MENIDLDILLENKSSCSWLSTYGVVSNLIRSIDAKKIAEVGVAYGYHAEHILDEFSDIEYYGFDPYVSGYDPNDGFDADIKILFGNGDIPAMDRLYNAVNYKLESKYGDRAKINRIPGEKADSLFEKYFFDIAYIDGDHTYDGVIRDLNSWYPLVKKGGILCGDDYNWDGVRDAVLDFFKEKEIEVFSPVYHKWYVVIPE